MISPELSLSFFFFFSFHLFGLERLLGRYPPTRTTIRVRDTQTDTITSLLSMALFPDLRRYYFNDDPFYDSMTNDDYFFRHDTTYEQNHE